VKVEVCVCVKGRAKKQWLRNGAEGPVLCMPACVIPTRDRISVNSEILATCLEKLAGR